MTTTPPNAPEVDVLDVLDDVLSVKTGLLPDEHAALTGVRTAVAAMLTREAALVARNADLEQGLASACHAGRGLSSICTEYRKQLEAMTAERDALAAEVGALRLDTLRWREVSDKAWFVDAASYVYGLRTGSFGPTCDMDEVVSAIDAARAEAGA